jgi:REP element-mobilizing transposase RayT
MLYPLSSKCVAKEWRSVWQVIHLAKPDLSTACLNAFCKMDSSTVLKIILNHKELNVKRKSGFVLMKERFKSENIEDENYLLITIRYFHQNPLKPGIGTVKLLTQVV